MSAAQKFDLNAAAMAVRNHGLDLDLLQSEVDALRVLLQMAREQCEWTLADVEQSREAQSRLHVLLEAARGKVDGLHNDTDVLSESLRKVGRWLDALQAL